jgi:hypothetical protein
VSQWVLFTDVAKIKDKKNCTTIKLYEVFRRVNVEEKFIGEVRECFMNAA